MSIKITSNPSEVIIKIDSREFNFKIQKELRDSYRNESSEKSYIVDLASVDFIESSALGMLLLLREHAGGDNARVRLINCSPGLRQLFNTVSFNTLFEISS